MEPTVVLRLIKQQLKTLLNRNIFIVQRDIVVNYGLENGILCFKILLSLFGALQKNFHDYISIFTYTIDKFGQR